MGTYIILTGKVSKTFGCSELEITESSDNTTSGYQEGASGLPNVSDWIAILVVNNTKRNRGFPTDQLFEDYLFNDITRDTNGYADRAHSSTLIGSLLCVLRHCFQGNL